VVDDYIQHLNYFASGTTHGPGGVKTPSEGLKRALELPATWTDYLIQRDQYAGAVAKGSDNVSYFETDPAKPTTTNTVGFDASFSRNPDGSTTGLKYFWDFGDGRTAAGTNPKVTHTYASTLPHYYDVSCTCSTAPATRATTGRPCRWSSSRRCSRRCRRPPSRSRPPPTRAAR